MCLIFIALRHHPSYKLIVAANRDEFYNRKTAAAAYWPDHPEIVGGRDLEAMGTWLAMTKSGRIAMVTNFRDLRNIKSHAPSRGKLVTDFLLDDVSGEDYLKKVEPHAKEFNGFSVIAGTIDSLAYLSNYAEGLIPLGSGLFGLSNHLLETPWPKVEKGKREIQALLDTARLDEHELFHVLSDETISADDVLPDTGVGLERERSLSAAFIRSTGYGTRSSTVILVDYNNNVEFHERVFHPETSGFSFNSFRFTID